MTTDRNIGEMIEMEEDSHHARPYRENQTWCNPLKWPMLNNATYR